MEFKLKQYQCNVCGELSDMLDTDQPLPKGWTIETRFTHYCPKCSKLKTNLNTQDMKLKAQDLQIGDWVLYDNEPNIIAEVYEIIQGEAEVCFAGTNCMANIDEIKPIPITPEILKRSGFV